MPIPHQNLAQGFEQVNQVLTYTSEVFQAICRFCTQRYQKHWLQSRRNQSAPRPQGESRGFASRLFDLSFKE